MKIFQLAALALILSLTMISCGDDSAPELTISSPTNNSNFAPGDEIVFSGVASDDDGVTTVVAQSPDFGVDPVPIVSGVSEPSVNFTFNLGTNNTTPVGEYTVVFIASDTEGNSTEESVTVNLQ